MAIDMPPKIKRKFIPQQKVWNLRDPQTCSHFQEVFKACSLWKIAVSLLRNLVETQGQQQVCSTTKPTDGRNMKFGGG